MEKRRLRVLVADDDPDMVASLLVLLRDEGHEVLGVHHGADVVESVGDFAPDAPPAARALRQRPADHRRHHRPHASCRAPARRDGRIRLPFHQTVRAKRTTRHTVVA
jgi:hypothetical protein